MGAGTDGSRLFFFQEDALTRRTVIPFSDPAPAVNRGLEALGSGREREAAPLLRRALQTHPREARLWQVLGLLHRALDEHGPAIEALDQAARLAPGDARIAHARARAHLEAGLPATSLFEAALRLAPGDETVRLGCVQTMLGERGLEDAVALLKKELLRTPHWAAGHAELMRLNWMAGGEASFTTEIEHTLRSAPRGLALWRELLLAQMHAARYEQLLTAVSEARSTAGEHPMFDINEAAALDQLGRMEEAEPIHERLAIHRDPHLALYYVRHLLRRGLSREAADLALRWTGSDQGHLFWPYVSIAWRLGGDPRWEWLEGDERFVGIYDLEPDEAELARLAELMRSLHFASRQPVDQSLRGGTQTTGHLFARLEPEIARLRARIVALVERHVAQLPPPDPRHPLLSPPRGREPRFTGSWSVRLTGSGFHENHIHPGGWFSSAFYLVLPGEEAGGASPAGWLTLGEPPSDLRIDLPPIRLVEPRPGRLVLFPSTMWHGTRPFVAGERLTIAFDVARPV